MCTNFAYFNKANCKTYSGTRLKKVTHEIRNERPTIARNGKAYVFVFVGLSVHFFQDITFEEIYIEIRRSGLTIQSIELGSMSRDRNSKILLLLAGHQYKLLLLVQASNKFLP